MELDLTDEDIRRMAESLKRKLEENEKARKAYVDSGQFDEDYKRIYDYLERHENIDNESLRYGVQPDFDMEECEFSRFVEAVECRTPDENILPELWHDFFGKYWTWEGIVFRIAHGQGTMLQAWNEEAHGQRFSEEINRGAEASE